MKTENKTRCRQCAYLDYDFLDDIKEITEEHFCGLHGRVRVDIDGKQPDLNHKGGCGFHKRVDPQLSLWE